MILFAPTCRPSILAVTVALTALAAVTLSATPSAAASKSRTPPPIDAEREYVSCLQLAWRQPTAAFESALAWADRGGGDAAQRCAAIALFASGKPDQAAFRLEVIERDSRSATADDRAGMLGQAAQAWSAADQPARALAALDRALRYTPDSDDLLIDRAAALGALARYADAVKDLDTVLTRDPRRVDALVFRAAALRQLDEIDRAQADADRAVQLAPDNPEALFERGAVRRMKKDIAGARADWLAVAQRHPNTPVADLALRNIELIDVKR